MTINLTLKEALDKCSDWNAFCNEFGYGEWVVNEGGGHIEVSMTEQQALDHGIIKKEMEM